MNDKSKIRNRQSPRGLLQDVHKYSFYEAVRLLQGMQAGLPSAPRVGHQGPAERERIRFRPLLSLTFPPADIADIHEKETLEGESRYQLELTFMGLYGASSPLPMHYTEELIRMEDDESLLRNFLDVFHHRLFSLLFRTWEKYRHTVQYDPTGKDYYSDRLLTMLGTPLRFLPGDEKLRPGRLLAYAGLLTQQPRSAAALEALLGDHFDGLEGRGPRLGVEIEQCRGRWAEIPSKHRNRLGVENCTLGQDMSVGRAVFDRAGNFGINLGPMGLDDYMDFLPDGDSLSQLRELTDLFNNDCLDYEITLILRGEEIPRAQLSSKHTRLGWSSWLGESFAEDRTVTFQFKGWKHGRG